MADDTATLTDSGSPGDDAVSKPSRAPSPGRSPGTVLGVPTAIFVLRVVGAAVLLGVAVWIPQYYEADTTRLVSRVLYIAIAAMGLNLLTGFNGQISIGHGAFFGVGAFTSAILVDSHGWPFEATIPIAALLAALLGIAVGIPALRVRGLYLALLTLGLAVLFPPVATKYIKGDGGGPLVQPSARDLGSYFPDALEDDQYAYYLCLGVTVILIIVAWNLVRSRTGRAMIAVRDQELAASTLGVNLAATKVGAFAVSAAYAGIAGSLSVMVEGLADANNPIRYFQLSIEFLVAVVLGGAATILGPLVGAVVLVYLREFAEGGQLDDASWAPDWLVTRQELLSPAIYGIGLIAIVFVLPQGVVGGIRSLTARLTRRRPPVAPLAPSGSPADPDTSP